MPGGAVAHVHRPLERAQEGAPLAGAIAGPSTEVGQRVQDRGGPRVALDPVDERRGDRLAHALEVIDRRGRIAAHGRVDQRRAQPQLRGQPRRARLARAGHPGVDRAHLGGGRGRRARRRLQLGGHARAVRAGRQSAAQESERRVHVAQVGAIHRRRPAQRLGSLARVHRHLGAAGMKARELRPVAARGVELFQPRTGQLVANVEGELLVAGGGPRVRLCPRRDVHLIGGHGYSRVPPALQCPYQLLSVEDPIGSQSLAHVEPGTTVPALAARLATSSPSLPAAYTATCAAHLECLVAS